MTLNTKKFLNKSIKRLYDQCTHICKYSESTCICMYCVLFFPFKNHTLDSSIVYNSAHTSQWYSTWVICWPPGSRLWDSCQGLYQIQIARGNLHCFWHELSSVMWLQVQSYNVAKLIQSVELNTMSITCNCSKPTQLKSTVLFYSSNHRPGNF